MHSPETTSGIIHMKDLLNENEQKDNCELFKSVETQSQKPTVSELERKRVRDNDITHQEVAGKECITRKLLQVYYECPRKAYYMLTQKQAKREPPKVSPREK